MKRYFILSMLLLGFFACRESSSPRPVAEKFLNAMQDRNFEEAAKYGTPETVKLLAQLEKILELQNGNAIPAMGRVRIVSEEIQGRTATVFFTEEGVPGEQKITLKKITDPENPGSDVKVWRVSLRKEELPLPALPARNA